MYGLRYLFFSVFLILSLFVNQLFAEGTFKIDSPQLQMVGARASALGVDNPIILGDHFSFLNNPALLSSLKGIPAGVAYKSLLEEFDYHMFSLAYPLRIQSYLFRALPLEDIYMGVFYGQVRSQANFETSFSSFSSQIYEKSAFYAGYRLFATGFGASIYNKFTFTKILLGVNLKLLNYYVDRHVSSTSFAMDTGLVFSRHRLYSYLDEVDLSISIRDFLASRLILSKSQNKAYLSPDLQLGLRALVKNTAFYMYNHYDGGVGVGVEHHLNPSLFLRGSSNFKLYRVGLGTIFSNVSVVGSRLLDLSFDYTLEKNREPFANTFTHALTLSFLGASQPKAPLILSPSDRVTVVKERVSFRGVGPKNAVIYLYNNDRLMHTVQSDRYGLWAVSNLSLPQGKNYINARALDSDMTLSLESEGVTIYADNKAPRYTLDLLPDKGKLKIDLLSSEQLSKVLFKLDGQVIDLVSDASQLALFSRSPLVPNRWQRSVDFPDAIKPGPMGKVMSQVEVLAVDIAGNKSLLKSYDIFANLIFPTDKHVHYKPRIRLIGDVSSFVKRLSVNDEPVYLDSSGRYSISVPLKLGKNLLAIKLEFKEGKMMYYTCRVLSLKSFSDVSGSVEGQREISFMGTLGVLEAESPVDNRFYPNRFISRSFMAKLLVKADDSIELPKITSSVFSDVPASHPQAVYIAAAIKNGLVSAFADGTFRPDSPLTLAEIGPLLFKAGLTNFKKLDGDQQSYLKKWELAYLLAYLPQYQKKIDELINWETGYYLDL